MASFLTQTRERASQLGKAFGHTRRVDPRAVPLSVGAGVAALAVVVVIGVLAGAPGQGAIAGVVLGIAVGLIVMGRRTSAAALGAIEGQPGAAAAVLQSMRRAWIVTPAVAATRKQEFVHRAVGRPGVVLVGEGSGARVTALLKQERRKAQRAVGDLPVHEVHVGNGEGRVPLDRLQMHLVRLPKAIKARQIGEVDRKLSALGTSNLPIPKGPLPQGRMPRRRR